MKAITLPLVFIASLAFGAEKVSVADLLKDAKFDKKTVTVTGTVSKFNSRKSEGSKGYFLFNLTQDGKVVKVFARGEIKDVKDGVKVEVTGEFAKERKVGERSYKDEIDASLAKKGNSVKVVK